jgi:hypothetical protein
MPIAKPWLTLALLFMSAGLLAGDKRIHFAASQDDPRQLELNVSQKTLPEVLDVIAQTTGLTIHYSALPKQAVTVACAEITVTDILHCLLASQADLVFRYGQADSQDALQEVWILGAKTKAWPDAFSQSASGTTPAVSNSGENVGIKMLGDDDISPLLAMAKADDSESRTNAITALAAQAPVSHSAARDALQAALSDPSAQVRAQAVAGLLKQQDTGASPDVLERALQDSDVSVRLMAVNHADGHPVLLQDALNDSDETVRACAAARLEALSAQ